MSKSTTKRIPPPKGTRDLYPEDFLRQRYITDAWRRVSIRHGFDEISGPTFEMLELYKKKSGEGIVSELFSFKRAGGDDDYALRPEFTPTLARMYAEKANALPNPCKWFTAGPYFRAEKPQRGRLREFLQWNCDVLGGENYTSTTSDVMSVIIELKLSLGFDDNELLIRYNDRELLYKLVAYCVESNIDPIEYERHIQLAMDLIDAVGKEPDEYIEAQATKIDFNYQFFKYQVERVRQTYSAGGMYPSQVPGEEGMWRGNVTHDEIRWQMQFRKNYDQLTFDPLIVRGLAYYTGTVFELIAGGERAVAGGGRYDNLIELFGGPPTPAVGFGMGDVVLGLLLEDKGLMPEGPELMDALSQRPASLRPEAFVIASEDHQDKIEPLLAQLRRGTESESWKERQGKPWDADRYETHPMHARRSYKSTKNIGKLLADARKQHAKFAVIIESDEAAKVENLDTREDLGAHAFYQVGAVIAKHL